MKEEAESKPKSSGLPAEMCEVCGVRAHVARTFRQRTKGLIGTRNLAKGEGLLILHCNSIHTFFMSFPIDATFLDKNDKVVKVVRNIRPGKFCVWGGWRASKVLETKST